MVLPIDKQHLEEQHCNSKLCGQSSYLILNYLIMYSQNVILSKRKKGELGLAQLISPTNGRLPTSVRSPGSALALVSHRGILPQRPALS
jgi:hypothetical protein